MLRAVIKAYSIKRGDNLDIRADNGTTPLHNAIEHFKLENIKTLISKGSNAGIPYYKYIDGKLEPISTQQFFEDSRDFNDSNSYHQQILQSLRTQSSNVENTNFNNITLNSNYTEVLSKPENNKLGLESSYSTGVSINITNNYNTFYVYPSVTTDNNINNNNQPTNHVQLMPSTAIQGTTIYNTLTQDINTVAERSSDKNISNILSNLFKSQTSIEDNIGILKCYINITDLPKFISDLEKGYGKNLLQADFKTLEEKMKQLISQDPSSASWYSAIYDGLVELKNKVNDAYAKIEVTNSLTNIDTDYGLMSKLCDNGWIDSNIRAQLTSKIAKTGNLLPKFSEKFNDYLLLPEVVNSSLKRKLEGSKPERNKESKDYNTGVLFTESQLLSLDKSFPQPQPIYRPFGIELSPKETLPYINAPVEVESNESNFRTEAANTLLSLIGENDTSLRGE